MRHCSQAKYSSAEALTSNRTEAMTAVLANLEKNMDLVCITGVEDKLQDEVKETLETLRSAGIKVSTALNYRSLLIILNYSKVR